MTLTSELAEKVEALYRENLEREFGDSKGNSETRRPLTRSPWNR